MHFFKFSLILSLLSISCFSFDDNSCFKEGFEVEVIHKGKPFGLFPVILKVGKSDCDITVYHEKLKYQKSTWKIDVCREPVHIKKGTGAVEVIKKTQPCGDKSADPFCKEFSMIEKIIQDDGLIFAEGQKENLKTNHGKTYCAYVLIKKYLDNSLVFNRGRDYSGALTGVSSTVRPVTPPTSQDSVPVSAPRPVVEGQSPPSTSSEESSGSPEESQPIVEEKEEEKGKGFF
ncbi:MAG: hypothetical protein NXH75_04970 [Halobacteriovoraceae bacterium]|nr:hypothetical protein [Halobacteriovoraceae bacterium]